MRKPTEDARSLSIPLIEPSSSEENEAGVITYNNAPVNTTRWGFKQALRWQDYPDRMIISNKPDFQLCDNSISTSKYTVLSFVPKNLIEQFSKLSNFYFLMIPLISTSDGRPVMFFPLTFVVVVSAIKDLVEDLKRHREDAQENNSSTLKYQNGRFVNVAWKDLYVGDIIKVINAEFIPADIVLLKTSEEKGECYVETKNLDGETNLKRKCIAKELLALFPSDESFGMKSAKIDYEKPNPFLYQFNGSIKIVEEGIKVPLDANNFLLRSSSLRSEYAIGMVVYTGHETKIMLNSVKSRPKSSSLETLMQRQIVVIFLFQFTVCILSAIISLIWTKKHKATEGLYLDLPTNYLSEFIAKFGNWMLLFTNIVPISLLVTLELVKFFQAKIISADVKMKNPDTDVFVGVNSSNLNEELGQVHYIFSDKTGTLTCNVMEFKYLNVKGKSFGDDRSLEDSQELPEVTNVDFYDGKFFKAKNDPQDPYHEAIHENLLLLAACHTIYTEEKDGDIVYNASSPDELALVNMARLAGYKFMGLDSSSNILVKIDGENSTLQLKLLHVLEFNSTRKRMSVIVEAANGEIILYCKGADNVILDRMDERANSEHIQKINGYLKEYSQIGLRTLLLSKRVLNKDDYLKWAEKYLEASMALQNREEEMMKEQEEIEKELIIIGATAIEDKLQDQVGETIEALKNAGIKVWVLTGDKVETAINIGYSCKLLTNKYKTFIIDGKTKQQATDQLQSSRDEAQSSPSYACVITGDALIHATESPELTEELYAICSKASVVVACRVSPNQKSQIVKLMKDNLPNITTLAIGDGANDVSMITAAHVGIGIRGVEGQQAARASDYSIGEFKVLKRLLLYYGRESMRKNSVLVLYNFFKNLIYIFPPFWFAFENGFSGQILFDPIIFQLYNVAFASAPILVYALIDKEYTGAFLESNPKHYKPGMQGKYFNYRRFWFWFVYGCIQSFFLTFIMSIAMCGSIGDSGRAAGFWEIGIAVFTVLVIIANLKILIISSIHNAITIFCVVGSILIYFLCLFVFNLIQADYYSYGIFQMIFENKPFILGGILVIVCTTFLDLAVTNQIDLVEKEKWTRLQIKERKRRETLQANPVQPPRKRTQQIKGRF